MDHIFVPVGRRRVLVADVSRSADGNGIGYGIMLKRIERVLRFGQVMQIPVFFVRVPASINSAVFHPRSEDVEIIPQAGWKAHGLRCVWAVTAPFRFGSPWLWTRRTAARLLLGQVYVAVERSRCVPKALRRFVVRPRPLYRRLQAANAAYASLSSKSWKDAFKRHAVSRIRNAEQEGRELPLRLSLPADRERAAIEQALALGISLTAPLVTVHVRESGFRSTAGLRQRSWDTLRNARIESYAEALTALVVRGYTVVRLGDRTMTPIRLPGVVDLATAPARNEWLEAWCVLRSEFLVGCDSGPSWLAVLAGVPILTVNAIHFRDVARSHDRLICKLARVRATGKTLSLPEMLTEGYLRTGLQTEQYEHLDNSPSDIRDAVLDMIDVARDREEPSLAQHRFNSRLIELGRELPKRWTGLEGVAILRLPRGTLSRMFAEKYLAVPWSN